MGGLILGFMSFIMVMGLQYLPEEQIITEMPMLVLASSISPTVGNIYFSGLLIAIFTTALANAHSLTIRIKYNIQVVQDNFGYFAFLNISFYSLEIFYFSRVNLSN